LFEYKQFAIGIPHRISTVGGLDLGLFFHRFEICRDDETGIAEASNSAVKHLPSHFIKNMGKFLTFKA
jgi:hypothetical protein